MRCLRQTRRSIHFQTAKDLPHPERNDDPEKQLISKWELRIWIFRRAVELIVFDEPGDEEEYPELWQVRDEAAQGILPEEYYQHLIGAFDKYPHDLPVNWLLAREIIKEILSVQQRNIIQNQQNK